MGYTRFEWGIPRACRVDREFLLGMLPITRIYQFKPFWVAEKRITLNATICNQYEVQRLPQTAYDATHGGVWISPNRYSTQSLTI